MSGFPELFSIREVSISSNAPNWREQAENLAVSVRSKGAHRWEVRLVSTRMRKMVARELFGELQELQGGATFTIVLPGYTDRPIGVAGGSPSVRVAADAGVTQLQLQGGPSNQSGQHRAGDYFRVGGHQKVYMITKAANTNGQGQTTIQFKPALKNTVTVGTPLTLRNVAMTLLMRRDPIEFTARSADGELTHFELDCYEDVR